MSVTGCWQNLLFFSPNVSPNTCVTLTFTFSPISSSQIAPDCYQLCSLSNAPLLAPPPCPPSIMFALTLSLSPSVPLSPFFLLYCSPSLFFFFAPAIIFKGFIRGCGTKDCEGEQFQDIIASPLSSPARLADTWMRCSFTFQVSSCCSRPRVGRNKDTHCLRDWIHD